MEKSDGAALPFTGLRRCRAGGMKCLQGRQREHGLLLLVLCLHWDEQPGLGWELGLGAAAAHAPSSWCLSPSALEPPKKLPSHLPDPLRPPVLCSPHAWLDKLTSCTVSFFPLPPLPLILANPAQRLSISWMNNLSPSYNPALRLTKQRREFCSLSKGREEENVAQGAEAAALSMLHLNPCASEGWRCGVTAESTSTAALGVSHEPQHPGQGSGFGWYPQPAGMLNFRCCRSAEEGFGLSCPSLWQRRCPAPGCCRAWL